MTSRRETWKATPPSYRKANVRACSVCTHRKKNMMQCGLHGCWIECLKVCDDFQESEVK